MTPRALKKWRLRLDMTQVELGTWLGVSRSTVNRWEGGTQAIPHMVGLLAARYRRPEDIECDCVEFKAVCDYHMGGRYRTDAERDVAWKALKEDPTDTECGCIRGVQACDYHAAGNGGRWREDRAD